MGREIDERIVDMQFNNKQFEDGVKDTLGSLNNLKKGLNDLDGDSGMFAGLSAGVEQLSLNFSTMQVAAITAIQNIVNRAVDAGLEIAESLFIEPMTEGWSKYEQSIESVRTIMNSTGKEMEEVQKHLDKLMWYTDETSYSYMDMANSIGRFTANEVELDTAVSAMQGISNWAALSGKGIAGAATAMDTFATSIGKGNVQLNEWRRIEAAQLATPQFKRTVLETAEAMGTLTKRGEEYIAQYVNPLSGKTKEVTVSMADFRSELKAGWFTSEVLLETLNKFGGYSTIVAKICEESEVTAIEAMRRVDQYMTEGIAEGLDGLSTEVMNMIDALGADALELGKKAFKAAQEAKSLGDVMRYVKDALSTGWMKTWEYIIGNGEEATEMWSNLAETLYEVIVAGGETRNELFSLWKEMGGRDTLLEGVTSMGRSLIKVIESIKTAWTEIFPPKTAQDLLSLTERFRDFALRLEMSDETADKLKRTFKGLFAVLDIIGMAFKGVLTVLGKVLGVAMPVGDGFLGITAALGDMLVALRDILKGGPNFLDFFDSIKKKFDGFKDLGGNIVQGLFKGIKDGSKKAIQGLLDVGKKMIQKFKDFFGIASPAKLMIEIGTWIIMGLVRGLEDGVNTVVETVKAIGTAMVDTFKDFSIAKVGAKIWSGIKNIFGMFKKGFTPVWEFLKLAASKIKEGALYIKDNFNLFGKIDLNPLHLFSKNVENSFSPLEKISAALNKIVEWFRPVFEWVAPRIVGVFKKIAEGFNQLGGIKGVLDIVNKALLGGTLWALYKFINSLTNLFKGGKSIVGSIKGTFDAITKTLKMAQGEIKAKTVTQIAIAIGILAGALFLLSKIPADRLLPVVGALVAVMAGLGVFIGILTAFAKNIKAVKAMSTVGTVLLGMGVGLMGVAVALYMMVPLFEKLAAIDAEVFWSGMARMGTVLGALGVFVKLAGGGKHMISVAVGLTIMAFALREMKKALESLAELDTMTGLLGLGWMLNILSVMTLFMGALTKISAVLKTNLPNMMAVGIGMLAIAGSMLLFAKALEALAELGSNPNLGAGLAIFAGILVTIAMLAEVIGRSQTKMASAGLGILMIATSMLVFKTAIEQMGNLEWETIAKGLDIIVTSLFAIGAAAHASKGVNLIQMGAGIGVIALALWGLKLVFDQFETLDPIALAKGLGTLVVSVLAIGGAARLAGSADMIKLGLGVGAIAGALWILAQAMGAFESVDFIEGVAKGLGVLTIVLGELWVATEAIDEKEALLLAGAIGVMSGAMYILAAGLEKVAEVPTPQIAMVMGLLAEMALIMFGLSGVAIKAAIVGGAFALIGLAVLEMGQGLYYASEGVKGFVEAMIMMIGLDLITVIESLNKFAIIIASMTAMSVVSPMILAMGAALVALGSGLQSVAVGINILDGAIEGMSDTSKDAVKMIVSVAQAMFEGFCGFFKIKSPSRLMADAARDITGGVVGGLKDTGSDASAAMMDMAKDMFSAFGDTADMAALTGGDIGQTLWGGLQEAFVDAEKTGSKELSGMIVKDGQVYMTDLATALKASAPDVTSSIKEVGKEIVVSLKESTSDIGTTGKEVTKGLAAGIRDGAGEIGLAAKSLGRTLLDGLKAALKIKSPSKATREDGQYAGQGLILGLQDMAKGIRHAAEDIGKGTIDTLKDSFRQISDMVESDIDMTPTIRPVIDLSGLEQSLADTFGATQTLNVGEIKGRAATVGTAQQASAAAVNQSTVPADQRPIEIKVYNQVRSDSDIQKINKGINNIVTKVNRARGEMNYVALTDGAE